VARSFDENSANAALFSRIATPVGKYWVNKRVTCLVAEAMECLGGGGYIEESIMPRLYRQSPVNSIWEGSGNVICLDVLRTLTHAPGAADVFVAELEDARGASSLLDAHTRSVKSDLARPVAEVDARRLVERMALALQGAALVRTAPSFVADGFCAARLDARPGFAYGAGAADPAIDALLGRAMPKQD
jgi:putative acyl-CoA dehydrogenase